MSSKPDRLAIEAEADRLSGVYLRIVMLAKARWIEFETAGREAVAKGLVSAVVVAGVGSAGRTLSRAVSAKTP